MKKRFGLCLRLILICTATLVLNFAGCPMSTAPTGDSELGITSGDGASGDFGVLPRGDSGIGRDAPPEPFGDSDIDGVDPGPVDPVDPDVPLVRDDGFQSGTLTAGSFDDLLNFEVFRDFLSEMLQHDAQGDLPDLDLGRPVTIRVRNEADEPIGDARVVVTAAGAANELSQAMLDLTTGSDGRVLFLTGMDGAAEATEFHVTVHPPDGSQPASGLFDLDSPQWSVTLQGVESNPPAQLDLVFVVDTTGSMSDELEYLKVEMDSIAAAIADEYPNVDQRFALVLYRDEGDRYVTRTFDFTASLADFQSNLADQRASGGGDYPEAMHLAIEEANQLSWREVDSARVLFLVADAPPHAAFAQRTLDALSNLRQAGVAIYPVAASGVAAEAELIMRTAALMTLSQYIFVTDDSGVGNPHAEPHIPCYHVQRLDLTMIRMIAGELEGRRIEPDADDIIRTVGNPVDGVCTAAESE